jgi:hypothetical protein
LTLFAYKRSVGQARDRPTCARANHANLLFKGDDFSKTDIAPAIRPL